ncbi:MAG: hypothetical protein ACE5IY_14985 [bacterium]
MRRVLVGTVGYHNLRDYSLGPKLIPKLREINGGASVEIEEMNWGPIAIVQNFQSLTRPYDRIVFVCSRACGRSVGTVTTRRWAGGLPSEENLQERIAEAVTGVISMDNLLIIGEYFQIWPDEVVLVDVEPGKEEMGETFTPEVEVAIPEVLDRVRALVIAESSGLSGLMEMRGDELV